MNIRSTFVSMLALAPVLLSAQALSAESLADLDIFKSGGMTQGLWRVELLESSDSRLMQMGGVMGGKVGICMDAAERLSKDSEMDDAQCKSSVVRNTRDGAEVDVDCADGNRTHIKVTRESDKSFLIDNAMTDAKGKQTTMKARYSYEGACKGDSTIQMDKNSAACKQMQGMDMSKMAGLCAKLPAEAKAQCEQQMKNAAGMCQ